jgi:hypothetical protein
MKLSDAIILGSTTVKLDASQWLTYDHGKELCKGCLLGAAFHAASGEFDASADDIVREWPWLARRAAVPSPFFVGDGSWASIIDIISSMATEVGKKRMTFEQAIEWIRSVEPAEELKLARDRGRACALAQVAS